MFGLIGCINNIQHRLLHFRQFQGQHQYQYTVTRSIINKVDHQRLMITQKICKERKRPFFNEATYIESLNSPLKLKLRIKFNSQVEFRVFWGILPRRMDIEVHQNGQNMTTNMTTISWDFQVKNQFCVGDCVGDFEQSCHKQQKMHWKIPRLLILVPLLVAGGGK